jgi:hypothetical protein
MHISINITGLGKITCVQQFSPSHFSYIKRLESCFQMILTCNISLFILTRTKHYVNVKLSHAYIYDNSSTKNKINCFLYSAETFLRDCSRRFYSYDRNKIGRISSEMALAHSGQSSKDKNRVYMSFNPRKTIFG